MNRETLYGSARWATDAELKAAGLYKRRGLHFGLGPDRRSPLWLDGDAPLFTAAGSGSGKGTTIIIPAILTQRGPLFVLDPKGENAALTLHHQARLGKDAYCINPWGIHHDAPWFLPMHAVNPLDVLRADSPSLVADCKLIMEMMIPKGGGGDEYWTLKPRELGFAVLLWQVRKEGRIDAQRLYALLSSIFARPALWKQIVDDLLAFPDMEIRRIAGEIEYKRKEAQGEFSGITGKLFEALSFISDPALSRCLKGGDFSLSVLTGKKPATIYLIVPGEFIQLYAPFMRLMIGVAMLYKGYKPQTPPVGFLLDEAAQLGHFEMLKTAYSYKRGGGVRTWAFFQSVGQLEDLYGRAGGQSMMESAQLRQFFGVGHYDTARLVSDMLGVETVFYNDPLYQSQHENEATNVLMSGGLTTQDMLRAAGHIEQSRMKSATRRLLMQPDEVLRLEPDQQVCFISGKKPSLNPVLAGRRPYYLRPDLAGAYLSNPYRPPFDRVKVASRFGWSWTWKVWSHEVLPHLAGLPQYQQGMMSYAARFPLLAASRASGGVLGGSVGRGVGKLLSGY
jgi:type IV secretion system protein VirD4